jgi:hypothetical protein
VFEVLDIGSTVGLRPVPLRDPRFTLTAMPDGLAESAQAKVWQVPTG